MTIMVILALSKYRYNHRQMRDSHLQVYLSELQECIPASYRFLLCFSLTAYEEACMMRASTCIKEIARETVWRKNGRNKSEDN